jgi:hypothetical protein
MLIAIRASMAGWLAGWLTFVSEELVDRLPTPLSTNCLWSYLVGLRLLADLECDLEATPLELYLLTVDLSVCAVLDRRRREDFVGPEGFFLASERVRARELVLDVTIAYGYPHAVALRVAWHKELPGATQDFNCRLRGRPVIGNMPVLKHLQTIELALIDGEPESYPSFWQAIGLASAEECVWHQSSTALAVASIVRRVERVGKKIQRPSKPAAEG